MVKKKSFGQKAKDAVQKFVGGTGGPKYDTALAMGR